MSEHVHDVYSSSNFVTGNLLGDSTMASIVKTDEKTVRIAAYNTDMFSIINTGIKAKLLMGKKLTALVVSKHGKDLPTFAEYSNDCDALTQLVRDKGLSEQSDHYHRAYRDTLIELYGALPVSMETEARRKYLDRITTEQRTVYDKALSEAKAAGKPEAAATALAVRAVKTGKSKPKQDNPGAPKDEPKAQVRPVDESVEQLVARVGMFPLLDAIVRTLNAETRTATKGKALAQLTAQLARELKPAEVKEPKAA
jgi:hypothetical protein